MLKIVPQNATMQAELLAPSSAIGFIHQGERVLLRYSAFPYQKFGEYWGTVVSISRAALNPEEVESLRPGRRCPGKQTGPFYRVIVKPDSQFVKVYGEERMLPASMQVQAYALLDRRPLYQWILEPLYDLGRATRGPETGDRMKLPDRMLQAAALVQRRTPLVLQTEAAECGLACLAMIAGRYGHRVDLPALRRRHNLSLRGTTLHDLVRIASSMRLATRALRAELPHLRRLRLPCILHWDHNHFVVLTRVGSRSIVILDPAVGRRYVPLQEVDKRFTGIVLEAWPTEGFERKTERARVRIWELLCRTDGFAAAATQVLAMSLVLEAIGIAIPIGFQLVLDDVVVSNDRDLLTLIALGIGLVLAFRALIDFVRSWAIMAAGSTLTMYWKMSLFRHLLRLPLSFFERRHAGDVASRFMLDRQDPADAEHRLDLSVGRWRDGVRAAGHDVALRSVAGRVGDRHDRHLRFDAQPRLPALPPGERRGGRLCCQRKLALSRIPARHGEYQGAGDRRSAAGIWNNYLVDRVGAELRVGKIDLIFTIASTFLFGLDRIVIIFFGARAVMGGMLSVGMLVAFLAYKDQFSQRVGKFLDTIVRLGTLTVHGERIADIALAEPEQGDIQPYRGLAPTVISHKAGLSARAISFRYSDNEAEDHRGFRPRCCPRRVHRDRRTLGGWQDNPAQNPRRVCCARPPAPC